MDDGNKEDSDMILETDVIQHDTVASSASQNDNQDVEFYHSSSKLSIVASNRQQGNPFLSYIRNIPVLFANIVPDYLVGESAAVVFISLRYNRLYPNYLESRIRSIKNKYRLQVLLCLIDLPDFEVSLKAVTMAAVQWNMTLVLAWSQLEAARIMELLKSYQNKPSDILRGRIEGDHQHLAVNILTKVPGINKTDAAALMSNFANLAEIFKVDKKKFQSCPGIGDKKLRSLVTTFQEPFI